MGRCWPLQAVKAKSGRRSIDTTCCGESPGASRERHWAAANCPGDDVIIAVSVGVSDRNIPEIITDRDVSAVPWQAHDRGVIVMRPDISIDPYPVEASQWEILYPNDQVHGSVAIEIATANTPGSGVGRQVQRDLDARGQLSIEPGPQRRRPPRLRVVVPHDQVERSIPVEVTGGRPLHAARARHGLGCRFTRNRGRASAQEHEPGRHRERSPGESRPVAGRTVVGPDQIAEAVAVEIARTPEMHDIGDTSDSPGDRSRLIRDAAADLRSRR